MNSVIIELTQKQIIHNSNIYIKQAYWDLFPDEDTEIELECGGQVIERKFNSRNHEFAMGEWFTAYKLKGGDKVKFTPSEEKRKYHLELLKE